jgi:hypothetical protein
MSFMVEHFLVQNARSYLNRYSVDPNFANLTDMTPLDPPFEGGKFSPPPQEGELEGVNLDLLILQIQFDGV